MRLLLAEDEEALSEALVDILTYHKFLVDAVYNGEEALHFAKAQVYDTIILDIMMPKASGLEVLREIRHAGILTPVLLLTAKTEVEDRIGGLDMGADDYLTKPFAMGELLARLRAMLRRRSEYIPEVLRFGNIALNTTTCLLSGPEGISSLSKLEYRLMELFMLNPKVVFSAERLLERVWGCDSSAEAGTVWVYISYLRKKLAGLKANALIVSRRGLGYLLELHDD